MHKFARCLLTEWRKLNLPFAGKTFVVATSGGADSVSLALALNELRNRKKLNLRFVLAHFNHQLRGQESEEDEVYVKNLAQKFNFELACNAQNQAARIADRKGNLEQNARRARYEFLYQTAENLNAAGVLTAHTLNDQAETFLLNLIRGSGLEGLGGMKPCRNFELGAFEPTAEDKSGKQNQKSEIHLIRPLLRWAKRADTENFCFLNEIEFRSDAMNEDLAFRRVRIRKVLLPLLMDFNPKIVETLGKTAELLREDAEQLAFSRWQTAKNELFDESETAYQMPATKEQIDYLFLKDLRNVFPSMRRFILREWLKNRRGDARRLSAKHFEAIENLILSRKSGKRIELPGGEIVSKTDGKLLYEKTKVEKT